MNFTHYCDDGGPCPMPPHPEVVAHMKEELTQQGNSQQVISRPRRGIPLGGPTGTKLGLNDGMIFPESRFPGLVSHARMSKAALERQPLRGSIKAVVVLVEFPDQRMLPGKLDYFKELFFSTGRVPTKSVTEYYSDVSNGKISLEGDILGPVMMPSNIVHYANNESGFSNVEPNIRTMAADAYQAVKSNIDLKALDNDKNGQVDAFIVVHAGKGAETVRDPQIRSRMVWSAKWNLPGAGQTANGTNLSAFLTIPEDAKLGVCAHELGHLLFGWPDLYDIDSGLTAGDRVGVVSAGLGDWCLMAGGSWGRVGNDEPGTTPCHPSAWCKVNQGWVTRVNETDNRSITLHDVKSSPHEVHRLWTNGDLSSKEYFLIEHRQPLGFDASLPGTGMLVYHVDDSKNTNQDENHQWVGLKQADGRGELEAQDTLRGDGGDPFPGTTNNSTFGPSTNPSSVSYSNFDTNVSLTNITQRESVVSMDVTVRAPQPRL